MKYRILLHSMTFYRDFGMMYVLSKILEKLGCECLIASNENYTDKHVKLWNPHAVFYVTGNRTELLKKTFPKAKLFLCSAEGSEGYEHCDEVRLLVTGLIKDMARVYIWGERTCDNLRKANEEHRLGYDMDKMLSGTDKFLITGSPRLDLIKYRVDAPQPFKKIRIGFIGYFASVNIISSHPISCMLRVHSSLHDAYIARYEYCFKLLKCYTQVMENLGFDDYSYNLRPYPLENRRTYEGTPLVRDGKLLLDKHIDFSSWVASQDIIICGDHTETFSSIYCSGRNYICLGGLVSSQHTMHGHAPFVAPYLKNTVPGSWDALKKMAQYPLPKARYSEELHEVMNYLYSVDSPDSGLLSIAKDIVSTLDEYAVHQRQYFPLPIVERINSLYGIFYKNSYSSFSFHKLLPQAVGEMQPIAERILQESGLR